MRGEQGGAVEWLTSRRKSRFGADLPLDARLTPSRFGGRPRDQIPRSDIMQAAVAPVERGKKKERHKKDKHRQQSAPQPAAGSASASIGSPLPALTVGPRSLPPLSSARAPLPLPKPEQDGAENGQDP